jgi:hypothetical protein
MRTKMNIAVIAAVSAVALAGCGSSSDGGSPSANAPAATSQVAGTQSTTATTTGSTPASTTAKVDSPQATWANQLCSAMTGKIKPIQPPSVQATSPADTQKSLVKFIDNIVTAEGEQLQTLKAVGAPPGANAKSDWKGAVKRLRTIRKKLVKVENGLKSTNPTNAKQLQAGIADLGKKLKVLATYQGPVVDLSTSKAIGKAVTADPGCQALA